MFVSGFYFENILSQYIIFSDMVMSITVLAAIGFILYVVAAVHLQNIEQATQFIYYVSQHINI